MSEVNPSLAILVVIYNKEIDNSSTLKSLVDNDVHNVYIRCVNNGPSLIKLRGDIYDKLKIINKVEVFHYLENRPLSYIYNDFVNSGDFDRYLILDDDTFLEKDFITYFTSNVLSDFDLALPRVYSSHTNELAYPIIRNSIIPDEKIFVISPDSYFHSIGSGLVINRSLINKFNNVGFSLFDSNYALYGVDISLFRRISIFKKKNLCFKACVFSYIKHSMSSSEGSISDWRYKERLIDRVLSSKYYSKTTFHSWIKLTLILLGELVNFRFKNFIFSIKVFSEGKHPRCN